ncbi:DUF4333 domain-containing protein [Streptomyces sp. B-S-A8]|uniref:DUF4333 domain-containing protein n=1 Tax=Streptomyces solicavernae TaxID=3043614 RepID=A0ABT6RTK6_9ACTN|nr:DUF4333 domain-containing protein [Streptomyces sp. B-S-A8]MDI3387766.1 DUF4333 domain-containing protein [Streptomyces sp. B-S-A8]
MQRRAVGIRMAAGTATGVLAVLLTAGCSVGGPAAVSKDEVAEKASQALGKQVGREPDSVTCDEDLKAEVDATVRCELTADGQTYGLTVTAKSVDGTQVDMGFKVDDTPSG